MPRLSVVIITLNEEKNLARCLASVQRVADEIVVVDSGSTDRTVQIAETYHARVIHQNFLGYIEQKNFALQAASNDFILSLDGDEVLSSELENSISNEKAGGFSADCYEMNRRNWFIDQWIVHGTWYPDTKLRLIKKGIASWGGTNPHDKLIPLKETKVQPLYGDILHYTFQTMDDYVNQQNKFTSISAKAMFAQGRRAGIFNLLLNPFMAFLKSYIFHGGFRDGFNGYIIARQTANFTFLKYAKLFQLQRIHAKELKKEKMQNNTENSSSTASGINAGTHA